MFTQNEKVPKYLGKTRAGRFMFHGVWTSSLGLLFYNVYLYNVKQPNSHHYKRQQKQQSMPDSGDNNQQQDITTTATNINNLDNNYQDATTITEQASLFHDLEMKFYSILPLRVTSSLWGKINSYDLPVWMRSRLYHLFCRTYNCDMSEALESDYRNYRNLSEFFRRQLKPDSRPISVEPGVVSPADGLVLHFGPVIHGRIEGVKGLNYSVQTFLGLPSADYKKELLVDKENNELYHCIIYLAPGDYHRFHSPANWFVDFRKHFPGRLLSVRPSIVERNPHVLHINERVCYLGTWMHGFFSMTAVGATNVGSIKVNFDEELKTNRRTSSWRADSYSCFEHKFGGIPLKAGQDFGEFNFGSTVVVIFEAPKNATFDLNINQKIKYGQLLARIEPPGPEQTLPTTATSDTTTTKTTTTTKATATETTAKSQSTTR